MVDPTADDTRDKIFGRGEDKGKGWRPDLPDFRDRRFGATYRDRPLADIPDVVSHRAKQSPVRDQRDLGACTGFSICAAIEYLRRTDADEFSTIYSPLFTYYEERVAEGTVFEDAGAFL